MGEVPLPCKPDSVPARRRVTVISLPACAGPRLRGVRLIPGSWIGRAALSLFCLAPRGVCRAARVAPDRGGLLPHHFTLACALAGHRRFAFCCTFRPGSSRIPVPRFHEARCPMVSGLSSTPPVMGGTATVRGAATETLPAKCPGDNLKKKPMTRPHGGFLHESYLPGRTYR